MAVQVLLNAVDVTTKYLLKSLSIKNSGMQGIVAANIDFVDDPPGSITPALEQVLRILNNGNEVFEGKVKKRRRRMVQDPPGAVPRRVYSLSAQDYTHLLTQDVIDATEIRTGSRTDKAEVEYLITTYTSKGLTVGTTVQNTGTISRDIDYSGMNLYEALEEAGKWMATAFYVDMDLKVHWFNTEADAAPFNLSDAPNNTTTFGYRDLDLEEDSVGLENAVWVIGTGITGWRVDAASVAIYGRIETTLRDSKVTTAGQLNAAGDAYLAKHAFPEEPISLDTFKDGLRAGMTVQITNAQWSLSAVTYRIVKVTAKHHGTTSTLIYQIDLDSRPVDLTSILDNSNRRVVEAGNAADGAAGAIAGIEIDLSVAGANLVKNSSFENGSAPDWTVGSQWVFGFAVADAFHGAEVARVVPTGTNTGELVTTDFIPVAKSDFYFVSLWSFLRARSAGTFKVAIREYSAAGALLATTTLSKAAAETEWTRWSQRFGPNAQAGSTVIWQATTAKIKIAFFADGSPNGTWDVDGVQVERGKIITAYAPRPQELIDFQITATQIADDAVTSPKIIANAVVAGKIATDAVTAGTVAADAITGREVATGTLNVGHLQGDPGNLVANPSFEYGSGNPPAGWGEDGPAPGAVYASGYAMDTGASTQRTGTGKHLVHTQPNPVVAQSADSIAFPVVANRRYRWRYWHRGHSGNNAAARARLNILFYDADGTLVSNTNVSQVTDGASTAWAEAEGTIIADSTAVYARVRPNVSAVGAVGDKIHFEDFEFYAADKDIDAAGGRVTITSTGIQIKNQFDEVSMTAAGFTGSWLSFIRRGFYNADFEDGITTDIPASMVGTASTIADYNASLTSDLPYWIIQSSSCVLAKLADSNASSGFCIRATTTDGSGAGVVFQDIPILPGQHYLILVNALQTNGGTLDVRPSWRDKNHALIGSQTLWGIPSLPTAYAQQAVSTRKTGLPVAPANARYLRVRLDLTPQFLTGTVRVSDIMAVPLIAPAPEMGILIGSADLALTTSFQAIASTTLDFTPRVSGYIEFDADIDVEVTAGGAGVIVIMLQRWDVALGSWVDTGIESHAPGGAVYRGTVPFHVLGESNDPSIIGTWLEGGVNAKFRFAAKKTVAGGTANIKAGASTPHTRVVWKAYAD